MISNAVFYVISGAFIHIKFLATIGTTISGGIEVIWPVQCKWVRYKSSSGVAGYGQGKPGEDKQLLKLLLISLKLIL